MSKISASKFCTVRLKGQPAPHDLAILLDHADELKKRTGVSLNDSEDWAPWADTSYLSEAERKKADIAANIRAIDDVCQQIAFIAGLEDSEYMGYWLGSGERNVAISPLVVLDNEGQFRLCCGTTFVEAILERTYDQEFFDELKGWFKSLDIAVSAKSVGDLQEPSDVADPADLHSELYEHYMAGA